MASDGDQQALKRRLINVLRILESEGQFELTYGHVSCRTHPGSDRFLILADLHERGLHIAEAEIDDIVTMSADGETGMFERDAPGERFIHLAAYMSRPDVNAVVHCHPRLPTAFSIAGVEIEPVDHLGVLFAPRVPIHDYSGQIDTREKAEALAATLGSGTAALIRSHGVVVVGSSLERACIASLALDRTAGMQYCASQIGTARPVPEEFTEGRGRFSEGLSAEEYFRTAWTFYCWKHGERLIRDDAGNLDRLNV